MTLDRIIMVVAVLAMSGLVTYVQVAKPDVKGLFNIKEAEAPKAETPAPSDSKTPDADANPTPAPAPVATPAPAPAPAAAPAAKTATTVSFVHMRAGKSTSTPIVYDLDGGTVVELRNDSDRLWQGVTYKGKPGYIYKSYLQY